MVMLARKSLDAPEETQAFPHGSAGLVRFGGAMVGRGVLQPGWRWSQDLKPLEGTASCEKAHFGYLVAGRLGEEMVVNAGDVFTIPPGHDAWVIGDKAVAALEFGGTVAG